MAGFALKCEGRRDGGLEVVCVFLPTPKLLMTLVFVQSKHSPTPNTMEPSNPAHPLNKHAF